MGGDERDGKAGLSGRGGWGLQIPFSAPRWTTRPHRSCRCTPGPAHGRHPRSVSRPPSAPCLATVGQVCSMRDLPGTWIVVRSAAIFSSSPRKGEESLPRVCRSVTWVFWKEVVLLAAFRQSADSGTPVRPELNGMVRSLHGTECGGPWSYIRLYFFTSFLAHAYTLVIYVNRK